MTTSIGHRMLQGHGVRYHHAAGDGVVRHVASAANSHLGLFIYFKLTRYSP